MRRLNVICVCDTVAALGWAHFRPMTYDGHFPRTVRFARHANGHRRIPPRFRARAMGWLRQGHRGETGRTRALPAGMVRRQSRHIGGSYPDNESRLSDITLKWMADFIEVDRSALRCSPSSAGMMHDECMVGMAGTPLHWYPADRDVPPDAILHETVYERLKIREVRNFIGYGPYRPAPLRNHAKAKVYYKDLFVVASR